MPTLRADENRYLLQVDAAERALARRVPAARWAAELRGYHLPRRDGVILALDRVFGHNGWQYDRDVETDIAEVRGRVYDAPRERAHVRIDGTQLAVQCDIGDRELVKIVPGYRWSPSNRTWYVPGVPVALEMLREAFGDLLDVDDEAVRVMELRALDEQRAIEADRAAARRREEQQQRLRDAPPPAPPEVETSVVAPPSPATDAPAPTTAAGTENGVVERLERIDATLQRMEALFARFLDAIPAAAAPAPPSPAAEPDEDEEPPADWRALLQQSKEDAAGAFDQASRLLQTSGADGSAELRAVAGVAANTAGRTQQAFDHLSIALAPGTRLEPGLARLAGEAFEALVLGFLNDDLGPTEPIGSIADVRRVLREELYSADGFGDAIGSPQARATLERLVTDQALRAIRPDLADFCRVAHLLSVVRGGGRMVQGLVADVLKEDTLHPDAQALTTMLFANTQLGARAVDDWLWGWPRETEDSPLEQQRLVESALKFLPLVDDEIVAPAALSVLAMTATSDDLPLSARRTLVNFIPAGSAIRNFAEFLALYRVAATGGDAPWAQFPGWVKTVAGTKLERSAPYLQEVFVSGAPNAVKALSEALLPALETFGITEPGPQLMDLLGLLEASPRTDNLLNELGRMVEDAAFAGANLLTGAQRHTIYRAAFDASFRMRHDQDARTAFQRLVRFLAQEGDDTELIAVCRGLTNDWKPLRLAATLTLVESLLAKDAPIAEVLDLVAPLLAPPRDDDADEVFDELAAIADLRADYREAVDAFVEKYAHHYERHEERTFADRRVVIVGGRQSQRVHAQRLFEHWQLRTDWLDSDEAERGNRLPGLITGACDFVVVNTAHIGHSSSGRAEAAAKAAGKPVVYNASNGLGRLRKTVWDQLVAADDGSEAAAAAPKRPRKTDQLRSLRRR